MKRRTKPSTETSSRRDRRVRYGLRRAVAQGHHILDACRLPSDALLKRIEFPVSKQIEWGIMAVYLVGLLTLLETSQVAAVDGAESPLVAGFDRFIRQQVLPSEVGGRLLLSELSCTACHRSSRPELAPKRGPNLAGVSRRLHTEWLQRFLLNPQKVKPGTTMPGMLHSLAAGERPQVARALAAFLATLPVEQPLKLLSTGSAPLANAFWSKGDEQRGRRLFHRVGCVACHQADADYQSEKVYLSDREKRLAELKFDPEERQELEAVDAPQPFRSVPLGRLSAKYGEQSLTYFLLDPLGVRPAGRMPNLQLDPAEAADIATFLLRGDSREVIWREPSVPDLVARGERWFRALNCAQCHPLAGIVPRPARVLEMLSVDAAESCLAEAQQGLPDFPLDSVQREALRVVLQRRQPGQDTAVKVDRSISITAKLLKLNCFACHERNGMGGVGPRRWPFFETFNHVELGDEGRIPPSLTGVGRKLLVPWMQDVLAGQARVRFHLMARMPRFGKANLGDLANQFATVDRGNLSRGKERPLGGPSEVSAGRTLLDQGCVQCHPLRGEWLPGVMGVDLADLQRRLRPEWFRAFLLDPAALKRGTRMPTFFPQGKSVNRQLLEGDVERQIASIWEYLKTIQDQPLPEKLVTGKALNFDLEPRKRPIVLRTFMERAGTHAIAVGFPARVHVAFDAHQVRVVEAWRGKFLNAHGTWFDRFVPPARPLGDPPVLFPQGVPLAVLENATAAWPSETGALAGYRFGGYRLDRQGVPTFLYRTPQLRVEERFVPLDGGRGLRRLLKMTPFDSKYAEREPVQVWLRLATGRALQSQGPDGYQIDGRWTVRLPGLTQAQRGQIRQVGEQWEWIVPLKVNATMMLQASYQW